jgi:hypothetical protein
MYPLPPGKKLAVPPMHPDIPWQVQLQVLDFIERRMFVEAVNLAEDAEDDRCRREFKNEQFGKELRELAEEHVPSPSITLKRTGRRRSLAA